MTSGITEVKVDELHSQLVKAMPFDWRRLSSAERRACFGPRSQKFAPQQNWTPAWEPAGRLSLHWENELGHAVRMVLDSRENRRYLRKSRHPPWVRLLLLSSTSKEERALPFIVFEHCDAAYLDAVTGLVRKEVNLAAYGLQTIGLIRRIELLMEANFLAGDPENDGDRKS